jgi:hypothetical protein
VLVQELQSAWLVIGTRSIRIPKHLFMDDGSFRDAPMLWRYKISGVLQEAGHRAGCVKGNICTMRWFFTVTRDNGARGRLPALQGCYWVKTTPSSRQQACLQGTPLSKSSCWKNTDWRLRFIIFFCEFLVQSLDHLERHLTSHKSDMCDMFKLWNHVPWSFYWKETHRS